jgi:hypothetical protein
MVFLSVIVLDCPILTIHVVRRGLNLRFRLTTKVIRKYQYEAPNLASLEAGLLLGELKPLRTSRWLKRLIELYSL